MKMFFKIVGGIIGGLILLITMPFSKKTKITHIKDWLEKEYPNRFDVLDNYTKDIIRNLSFSVKGSIVAEKSNPLIQADLPWDKRQIEIGLSKTLVDNAFANAHQAYKDALLLHKLLNENGLTEIAVGVDKRTVKVLIFAEPTPKQRQNSLVLLEKSFAEWQKEEARNIEIYYLEPNGKDTSLNEIVPLIYWTNGYVEFQKNMLYWIACYAIDKFSAKKLVHDWNFNTESRRFTSSVEKAREEAQKWASEHIKRPFTLLNSAEFDQPYSDRDVVNIRFPLVYQLLKEENKDIMKYVDGYISMDYHVEEKVFKQIKLVKE